MSKKPRSITKYDTTLADRMFNWPGHYLTEIGNGKDRVEHRATSAEESQKQAKKKWEKLKKK